MKKKNILIIMFLSLFFSTSIVAQTTSESKNKEVGIRMSSFSSFGFMYKKQKKEDKYNRVRLVSSNFLLSNSPFQRTTFSLGLAIGRETRKAINNKFKIIKGWEFVDSFSFSKMSNDVVLDFRPGIGMVFGLIYDINDDFSFNLELIPSINAGFQSTSGSVNFTGVTFGFDTGNASIGLMYSF